MHKAFANLYKLLDVLAIIIDTALGIFIIAIFLVSWLGGPSSNQAFGYLLIGLLPFLLGLLGALFVSIAIRVLQYYRQVTSLLRFLTAPSMLVMYWLFIPLVWGDKDFQVVMLLLTLALPIWFIIELIKYRSAGLPSVYRIGAFAFGLALLGLLAFFA